MLGKSFRVGPAAPCLVRGKCAGFSQQQLKSCVPACLGSSQQRLPDTVRAREAITHKHVFQKVQLSSKRKSKPRRNTSPGGRWFFALPRGPRQPRERSSGARQRPSRLEVRIGKNYQLAAPSSVVSLSMESQVGNRQPRGLGLALGPLCAMPACGEQTTTGQSQQSDVAFQLGPCPTSTQKIECRWIRRHLQRLAETQSHPFLVGVVMQRCRGATFQSPPFAMMLRRLAPDWVDSRPFEQFCVSFCQPSWADWADWADLGEKAVRRARPRKIKGSVYPLESVMIIDALPYLASRRKGTKDLTRI